MPGKRKLIIMGLLVGAVNGLFGSGGGLVAVPMMQKCGFDVKKSHAMAISLTAVFSLISAATYLFSGYVDLQSAIPYIPLGIIGAIIGALLLKRISPILLKRTFGILMIISGVRILI